MLRALIDIESVSGNETEIAGSIEAALRPYGHLAVTDGNVVLARTELGRGSRVVIAGHIDTVPRANNLPSRVTGTDHDTLVWGRGACDMKGGVAVQLAAAAALSQPARDVTWIFYDCEEVEASRNGLTRISRERPGDLAGDFAVLCEPSNARVEGGCQGTMRIEVRLRGVAAHSARAWMGRNAVHDAAPVLQRLAEYQPAEIEVDGLLYREGLNAVRISGARLATSSSTAARSRSTTGSPRQVPGAGRGPDPTGAEGLPVGGHRCRRGRAARPGPPRRQGVRGGGGR